MGPILELERAYRAIAGDTDFQNEFRRLLKTFVGRPTPLFRADRFSALAGNQVTIYLKREDLAHTGAHKINNAVGQALLAKRMGKSRIVAETGAGQHGVASAAACALLGLECVVYMGEADMARQAPNVQRMKLLGATVRPVSTGLKTLKDAISEAMRDWVEKLSTTHYLLGSVLGPHPYPEIVRTFQSVIGEEARAQILDAEGKLPNALIACVGGGSNAIGLFHAFRNDAAVEFFGVEAAGLGIASGKHAARIAGGGSVGVLQGTRTYLLQDEEGQIQDTHSVSAGMDYAAVGPEHSFLHSIGRAKYVAVGDQDALHAFEALARSEGILPALESSHALSFALEHAKKMPPSSVVVVNLSGRGDKDLATVEEAMRSLPSQPDPIQQRRP